MTQFNTLWYLSVISLTVISLVLPQAYSDIRDDIENNQEELSKLEKSYAQINLDIIKQKDLIQANEDRLGEAKAKEKFYREAMAGSWDAITQHEKALDDLNAAQRNLKESKDKLQSLYNQRNDILVRMGDLEDLIKELRDKPIPIKKPITKNGIIAITIDNVCKAFIDNDLESDCPNRNQIHLIYPNTKCEFHGKGCLDYLRQKQGFYYIYDPPSEVRERVKTIEIRHDFEEFHFQDASGFDNQNRTINFGVNRYVDDNCNTIYLDSKSWMKYLGDSIYYLYKNCDPAFTNFHDTKHIQLNTTKHDIASTYKYKLEQWQKQAIENCKTKICLYEPNQTKVP